MSRFFHLFGTLLFAAGVAGTVALPGIALFLAATPAGSTTPGVRLAEPAPVNLGGSERKSVPVPLTSPAGPTAPDPARAISPDPARAITHVRIDRIQLDADVVPARLVPVKGGTTWEVPSFKAGHAEYTAGAGEAGNAILLGHLTSLNAGNVFRHLGRAQPGDTVLVSSGAGEFAYRVVRVYTVDRTDLSPLAPATEPMLTMITCAGTWLPQLGEFSQRLIVRAELLTPDDAEPP